jgi:pentatricopeptide repeat protein
VPSLSIEGDIVDLRLFNPEDALARAEPFEEAMDYYREMREQEGFDW